MNNHQKSLSKKLGQAQLNSSTRFNAFQRAGFVTAPSPSQSFGDGVIVPHSIYASSNASFFIVT